MPSSYRESAARQFPGFLIVDDGCYAVRLQCCQKVILSNLLIAARQVQAASCGPNCKYPATDPRAHWGFILEEPKGQGQRPRKFRMPGNYESRVK